MSISLLLEMAASSNPDRTAVVSGEIRLTTTELSELVDGGAGVIAASGAQHAAYVGSGGVMLPLLLFSSARAGVAFTTFAYYRVRGAMYDGVRAMGWYSRADYARYRAEKRANQYLQNQADREGAFGHKRVGRGGLPPALAHRLLRTHETIALELLDDIRHRLLGQPCRPRQIGA